MSASHSHQSLPPPVPTRGRLGRFELIERIATGGMAEIYLAHETGGLDRLVVIKKILPHLAVHETFVDMFLQEARFVSRLGHPNVVQIYELGEHEGAPFIAMEYVPGASLRDLMRTAALSERPVPIDVAVSLIAQACAGAHAAHELKGPEGQPLGLVHRDISPHNLMVTLEGHVKLLDFGIAKATEVAAEQTRTGALKGKVHYMSPEQCRQHFLDRRSDIFALGIVAWELVTARRLFKRESELASMQAIVTGDRWDAREFRDECPAAVSRALDRALEVEPERRYATADEMRRAIAGAAEESGLRVSADVTAPFVDVVIGHKIVSARRHVEEALERTVLDAQPSGGSSALEGEPEEPTIAERSTARGGERTGTRSRGLAEPVEQAATTDSETGETSLKVPGRRRSGPLRAALLSLAVLLIVASAIALGRSYKAPLDGPPVVLGFAPIFERELLRKEMEPLRSYLEEATRRPVKLIVSSSYQELGDLLVNGSVHFASMPPNLYVETHRRNPSIDVIAFKMVDGASGSDGYIVVRADSPLSTAKDLVGKRLCVVDEQSTTGFRLPLWWLRKEGIDPDGDLAERRRSGNHLQVLRDLIEERCDFGGVYSGVYQTAGSSGVSTSQLRLLAVTGRVPQDSITAGPKVSDADKALIEGALLAFDPERHLGEDRRGQLEKISGFAKGSDRDYLSIRALLEEEAAVAPPPESTPPP